MQIVLAEEGIEISLNAYDSESTIAKISLHNSAAQDYHDVTLAVDSLPPTKIVSILAAGTTILYPVIAPSGEHKITVTTKEGATFSKDIYFAKSQTQIQEDIQKEQEVQEEKEEKYQQITEEKEKIESMKIKEENETEELETSTVSEEAKKPQISKDIILRIVLGIACVVFLGYIIFITIKEKTKKVYLFLLIGALLFLVKPTSAYLGCCSDTCYESGVCCGADSIWYQGCEDSKSQLYCPTQVLGDCMNCYCETPENCIWYLNDTNSGPNKECNIDGNMTNPLSSHSLCKEGFTLCADGSCQTDCSAHGGNPPCNNNTICDSGESCMCADCTNQHADNCSTGLVCINGVCQQQVGTCSSCSECDNLVGGCSFDLCTFTCGGQPCYYEGYHPITFWEEECVSCSPLPSCSDYEATESTCEANTCINLSCFWDNVTTGCKTCTTCEEYSDQSMCETNDCTLTDCHWCSNSGCGRDKPRNKCVTVPDDDMDSICNAGDANPLCTGSDECPNTPLGAEVNDEGCSEAQSSCLLEWDCTQSAWSSCEHGVRTRDPCLFIGPGNSTCDQPEFEPALTKACSTASLFSFFTTSNLLIVLLILIAFYVWQTSNKPKKTKKQKKPKKRARKHKK